MKKMRLDKILVHMGIGSRSEVQKLIKSKKVTIDGDVITKPECSIDPTTSELKVYGQLEHYQEHYHFIMNKPNGVITATEDAVHETVIDLMSAMDQNKMPAPVGRLDKDTEGLLILTTDGQLNHRLLSPKKHVDKTYYARVQGVVTEADQKAFLEGVKIGEYKCMPAQLEILTSDDISEVHLTIQEGKFHQVKRMMQSVGKEVIYLERIKMGGFMLPEDLERGTYRLLTTQELEMLEGK